MKKLRLSRETLHGLTDTQAAGALAADQQAVTVLSLKPCTWVVSDCKCCTTPDSCVDPSVAA